jgi:hemolysin III
MIRSAMRAINERPGASAWTFPQYSPAEAAADRAIHLSALPIAVGAVLWLLLTDVPAADTKQAAALAIYGCGLIAMLAASAAYNLSHPCPRKELLRRIDHAMIFVMIAGTYTPFVASEPQEIESLPLGVAIWSLAAGGVAVTVAFPRRFERTLLFLYLIMGWIGLALGLKLLLCFPTPVLLLLIAGGVAYSVGAVIHARCRFPFHNVVWHALVVLGAGLHWAAVALLAVWPAICTATV